MVGSNIIISPVPSKHHRPRRNDYISSLVQCTTQRSYSRHHTSRKINIMIMKYLACCVLVVVVSTTASSAFQIIPSVSPIRCSYLKKYSNNIIDTSVSLHSAISATALHGKLWKRLQIEEGEYCICIGVEQSSFVIRHRFRYYLTCMCFLST